MTTPDTISTQGYILSLSLSLSYSCMYMPVAILMISLSAGYQNQKWGCSRLDRLWQSLQLARVGR